MEKPTRARKRKLDTARWTWSQPSEFSGRQGVHREVGSEGHEEKYRAAVNGGHSDDEPVGQKWGQVEPALWGRRQSHPTHCTRVCAGGTVRKTSA